MTFNPLSSRSLKALAICSISAAAFILPASVMAGETAPAAPTVTTVAADYQVKTSSNGLIKSGVKAFNKGNFAKAVSLNKAVIRSRPNRTKTAIAQANLCASLAKLDKIEQAAVACDAALELRPELEVAKSNQALLQVRLAQK